MQRSFEQVCDKVIVESTFLRVEPPSESRQSLACENELSFKGKVPQDLEHFSPHLGAVVLGMKCELSLLE